MDAPTREGRCIFYVRCGSTMVHTPQRAHRASQTASAMATGTEYHTHHRTASAGARIYSEQEHPQRAHRASQTASAMATGTMYHTHHRTASAGAHTDRAGHRLRLYHARAATIGTGTPHSGRTEPHSEPQPLQMACAAALPCRNTPHRAHTAPQRASASTDGM